MIARMLPKIAVVLLVILAPITPAAAQDVIGIDNLEQLQPFFDLPAPVDGWFAGVAWSPDSQRLVVAGSDGLHIYSVPQSDHQPLLTLDENIDMYTVDWSPNSDLIASTERGKAAVMLWDASSGSRLATLPEGATNDYNGFQDLIFSPDGKRLAASNWANEIVYIWGVPGSGELEPITPANVAAIQQIAALDHPSGNPHSPYSIAFSPDSKTLGVTYSGAFPVIWNMDTYQMIDYLRVDDAGVLAFRPDGKQIALTTPHGNLVTLDFTTLEKKDALSHDQRTLGTEVQYNPNSTLLIATLFNNDMDSITFWDARRGTYLYTLETYLHFTRQMDFSPDGRWLATIGNKENLIVWGVNTSDASLTPSPQPVLAVDGFALVSTLDGETLNVRGGPGTNFDKVFELRPRTLVLLEEGPVEADGLRWWKIRTQDQQEGWAVEQVGDVQTLTAIVNN